MLRSEYKGGLESGGLEANIKEGGVSLVCLGVV
jgi:hypothetical protein